MQLYTNTIFFCGNEIYLLEYLTSYEINNPVSDSTSDKWIYLHALQVIFKRNQNTFP